MLKFKRKFLAKGLRGQYRSVSLETVARELAKYGLDLVGVQEIRWAKGETAKSTELYSFV